MGTILERGIELENTKNAYTYKVKLPAEQIIVNGKVLAYLPEDEFVCTFKQLAPMCQDIAKSLEAINKDKKKLKSETAIEATRKARALHFLLDRMINTTVVHKKPALI